MPLGLCATREARNRSKGVNFYFLHFYAFQSISSRLRHTLFSRKTRVSEASKMRACCLCWLYQSFIKNHSQLSYCSLEIVYAVKDCDPCSRAILFATYSSQESFWMDCAVNMINNLWGPSIDKYFRLSLKPAFNRKMMTMIKAKDIRKIDCYIWFICNLIWYQQWQNCFSQIQVVFACIQWLHKGFHWSTIQWLHPWLLAD